MGMGRQLAVVYQCLGELKSSRVPPLEQLFMKGRGLLRVERVAKVGSAGCGCGARVRQLTRTDT